MWRLKAALLLSFRMTFLIKFQSCVYTGEVLPTSEVEQSIIYCRKHKFTHASDAQPATVPLFSDALLHVWRCRCF